MEATPGPDTGAAETAPRLVPCRSQPRLLLGRVLSSAEGCEGRGAERCLEVKTKCDTIRTGSRSCFGDGLNVKLFTSPVEGSEAARAGDSSGCLC
ncbi:hypothetical protein GRJ2_002275100 [Grus japonensis]|uniref:Uncharacterized protein n=1 Tax=Grus japonensis TaxID=30415 RepID=A0ABC9XM17_GRUJA